MGKIAGTTYFKIDGQQLSVTGGIEVPMNTKVRDDVIGLDGSVDYKETSRAPYTKVTAKVPKNFPVDKITSSDVMTITSELANGQVLTLSYITINLLRQVFLWGKYGFFLLNWLARAPA